jgi:predicted ester cyclase
MIAEKDKITVRWRINGTHLNQFMGMKPSGNTIDVMGIIIYRLQDKKIVEYWGLFDAATVRKQIRGKAKDK